MNEHIVSFSGGKDSTAMLLRMVELNYPIDKVVFADTTLEYPELYDWIDDIEKMLPVSIDRVCATKSFDDWFYGVTSRGNNMGKMRGFPLQLFGCYWSRESKIKPIDKYVGKNNNVYIGIALDEKKRANAKRFQNKKNTYVFPLIDWGWTENDCLDYLHSRGLKHPLTGKFKRSGCWLCPKQSVESLESLCRYYPELWNKMKKYEADSPDGFRPNTKLGDIERRVNNE